MIKVDRIEGDVLGDMVPDLTPMLDILFILLVFFILTAGAVFHSLELALPENVSEELKLAYEPKHILLEIRPQSYALDGASVSDFEELKTKIVSVMEEKNGYELIVAGDKTASIERLLNILIYLQSQGIEAANILMQKDTSR